MIRNSLRRPQFVLFTLVLAAVCAGCRTTPVTGRKQILLVPEQQEIALGLDAFKEVASTETLSQNAKQIELVNRVGHRIAAAADRPDYEWEFIVIASPEQNAFCLPGGKVAVHEGILPVCENEDGLAVVMSHEIAHALARHGGERMTHGMAVEGVRYAVDYFSKDKEEKQRERFMKAYGLGAKYGVILPYSRKHETEADHMGVMLMAKAGYDPAEAPRFWERFAAAKTESGPPEFLSTHPSDDRRARDLLALVPEADQVYRETISPPADSHTIEFASQETIDATAPSPPAQEVALAPQNEPAADAAPSWWRAALSIPSTGRDRTAR